VPASDAARLRMNSVYTTTITRAARARGLQVAVLDPSQPVFELSRGRDAVRCFNALTDRVGAATFFLANHKHAANQFLRRHGFPVPAQLKFGDLAAADKFLARHKHVVVKPCMQWGGRGVAVDVQTPAELRAAVRRARTFEDDVVLEQCVRGEDQRLILVGGKYVAAIRRTPAAVVGNGCRTIAQLIRRQNRRACAADPSHRIPLDAETRRQLARLGRRLADVPRAGERVQVRLTSNYHTGGDATVITAEVTPQLRRVAQRVARLFGLPMVGIDFLVDAPRGKFWIIEVSPDLAISPPEGDTVVEYFLDDLFPGSRKNGRLLDNVGTVS
jgi:D-alanine-D-alanine ligase-like ATP-grasp enzyme